MRGEGGVTGHDEKDNDILKAIAFNRIKGGKPFDIGQTWFEELLDTMAQPRGAVVTH
tara:strand:+ start:2962 stop:3132 length:171 start_codon:yes stop_codon:yes gene_type:complete